MSKQQPELAKNRGKGAGQGRVKGTERQAGKDKQCKTTMSTTLKPCDLSHKDKNNRKNNETLPKSHTKQ